MEGINVLNNLHKITTSKKLIVLYICMMAYAVFNIQIFILHQKIQ